MRPDWRRFAFPLFLLALCGALYFWRLGITPLEDFDEAYYAEGAREMLGRHDLLTPYFNGQPFLLKPVLIYWIIAAAFRFLIQSEFAARAASAFLATGLVLLVYWFGTRTLSRRTGFFAGLALALSYMWIDIGRDASIDVPLAAAVVPAIFLFYLGTQASPRRKRWLYLPAYPLFGIALLAKGPVPLGVVVCGLLAYLLAARRLRSTLREAHLLPGIALCLAVAAPWYAYELIHERAFFSTFFIGEHFGHIRGQLARTEPVWGNLYYLLVYFFPWVAFLPAAYLHTFRQQDRGHVLRLCAWWSAAVIVLFSVPQSKLAHYLAPAFPPMALMVGAWVDAWLQRRTTDRALTAAGIGLLAAAGLVCTAAAVVAIVPPASLQARLIEMYGTWTPGYSLAAMLGAIGLASLTGAVAARLRRSLVVPVLCLGMIVAGFGFVGWFNPRKAQIQSQPRKELAQSLSGLIPDSTPVGVYYAKRNSTIFYLGRPIVDLGERQDEFPGVVSFLSSPAPAVAFTHRKFVPAIEQSLKSNGAAGSGSLYLWQERGDFVIVSNRPLSHRRRS